MRERVQISTLNNSQQTIHRNKAKTRRNLIAENNNNSNNKYAKSIVLKVSKRAENNVKYWYLRSYVEPLINGQVELLGYFVRQLIDFNCSWPRRSFFFYTIYSKQMKVWLYRLLRLGGKRLLAVSIGQSTI